MMNSWQAEPKEVGHLRVLSVCQFCYAAGAVLCGTLMAYYPALLQWVMEMDPKSGDMPPGMLSYFKVVCAVYAAIIYIVGILSVVVGIKIRQRKAWLFVMILSGIDVLFAPVGTVLGISTMVTLTKPHVKAWFYPEPEAPPVIADREGSGTI